MWKSCTKKDPNKLDYDTGVVSHPEPDILVKSSGP